MENYLENYQSVVTEIKDIILSGRKTAYNAANKAMILTGMWAGELWNKSKLEKNVQSMERDSWQFYLMN